MSKKTWSARNWKRIERALQKIERNSLLSNQDVYRLVSVYIREKGPVSGQALYYVSKVQKGEVTLLHPISLQKCTISKREFEKNLVDAWWPNPPVNHYQQHCDPIKVADRMQLKMKEFSERGVRYPYSIVREAIATLKNIPLDEVPLYEEPTALMKWLKNKRGDSMAKKKAKGSFRDKIDEVLKNGKNSKEETEKMSKKDKKNKKSKKVEKAEKKSKKEKVGTEKPSKEAKVKLPRGAKTIKAVVINLLHKKVGKTVSTDDLLKAAAKAKGAKEIPEKKLLSKKKEVETWAKKNGFSLAASGKGWALKAS